MAGILLSVMVDEAAVRCLEALPGVAVRVVKPEGRDWGLSDDLARGVEVLLCKYPPRNLTALTDLKVIQLSTVGYEHLRHLGLADRPLRACNARRVFDTAIAEWNLAMMVNLARDLRDGPQPGAGALGPGPRRRLHPTNPGLRRDPPPGSRSRSSADPDRSWSRSPRTSACAPTSSKVLTSGARAGSGR
jgi:hypothetical protein